MPTNVVEIVTDVFTLSAYWLDEGTPVLVVDASGEATLGQTKYALGQIFGAIESSGHEAVCLVYLFDNAVFPVALFNQAAHKRTPQTEKVGRVIMVTRQTPLQDATAIIATNGEAIRLPTFPMTRNEAIAQARSWLLLPSERRKPTKMTDLRPYMNKPDTE